MSTFPWADLERRADAHELQMMSSHPPWYWAGEFDIPISQEKAEALLAVMSERFKSYTGRTIEEHLAARSVIAE
jgi:hypothetical protein